jgi:hypothetical protein
MTYGTEAAPTWNTLRRVDWRVMAQASLAAFVTYLSMYAFRKPFTAATFAGREVLGVDYKVSLVVLQLVGYTLSKFLGVRFVSSLSPTGRSRALAGLMGFAGLSLLLFAVVPYPYNAFCLFLNGLPLGMIWGVVFSHLEGRRTTELLGAVMASSFIVSSGLVKNAGLTVLRTLPVGEFWMPLVTAVLFLPLLLAGMYLLGRVPPPAAEDVGMRAPRQPMTDRERLDFFRRFAPGILSAVLLYVGLTVFRDLRDNFAVELWDELGFSGMPQLLVLSELPIAFAVLLLVSLMVLLRDNGTAFHATHHISIACGLLLLGSTVLHGRGLMGPVGWMVVAGFSMYLPYMCYHTLYFERWIAHYRQRGNIGYLMYLADAFGYLGSTAVLLFRNFGAPGTGWLAFFSRSAVVVALAMLILGITSLLFFRRMDRRQIHPS